MISRLQGTLLTRQQDRVEVETSGGVVYEVEVPLTVMQRLPTPGSVIQIRVLHVVTESSAALYGFVDAHERAVFQRLLTASGVGARLAVAMMSALTAERLVRAIVEKDLAALTQVSGIGKKKAEKLALELSDRMVDLMVVTPIAATGLSRAQEAVQALVSLGFSFGEADRSVRAALESGMPDSTEELIRRALSA